MSSTFRFYITLLLLSIAAANVPAVSAASFQFQKKVMSVQSHTLFVVPVTVDPGSEAHYTARLMLQFPPNMLEVTSFTFSSGWLPLPQAGYDVMDNTRGELIKTAGLPRGFSAPHAFGLITFRAKQAGEAVVTVGARSFILNAASSSTLQSRPQIRVLSVAPSPLLPETGTSSTQDTGEPLIDLPVNTQNLVDIISTPEKDIQPFRVPLWFFAALGIGGICLAWSLVVLWSRYRR